MQSPTKYTTFTEHYEDELAAHPYTSYARQQRQAGLSDPYRPVYHFSAPEGPMNDPNGLCFWRGRWHLFYQAFPPHAPIHWGHAVSDDLLHWTDLPYALCPDIEEACWSGSTLAEENRVVALYYGKGSGNIAAVSHDPMLLNWEKIGLIRDETDKPYEVYDPCIWKQGEYYYSLSGRAIPHACTPDCERVEYLFRSKDLISWEYVHPFEKGGYGCAPGDDGACPYFWPIGDSKYILLYYSHMSGERYLIGEYDTEKQLLRHTNGGAFQSELNSSFPGGIHAASASPDGMGNVVAVINQVEGSKQPLGGTYQVVSLPRKLYLTGINGNELGQCPAPDFSALHTQESSLRQVLLRAGREVLLPELSGNVMEVQMEFEASEMLPTLDISVLRSADGSEATHIRCYRQRGRRDWAHFEECGGWEGQPYDTVITLDNMESSLSENALCRAPDMGSLFIHPSDTLRLRIFVDKSIVEVFVNERLCLATRAYPTRADSVGVSVRAKEKDGRLIHAERWDYSWHQFIGCPLNTVGRH